ncbi:MAG: dTMP kinase [Isosphaeraceae bacterium]
MKTDAVTSGEGPRLRRHPGFFLVLDGPDGGGKTTQAVRVADWLRGRGFDVVTCRDPGGTELGNQLRSLLMDRSHMPVSMRAEMLLFMASRAQMVEEVIRPALESGHVVVCDRFLLATIVYQGIAGGLDPAEIAKVGIAATGGLLPDLTIVLDVLPETARRRAGPARDRIEDRPSEYQDRVRAGYVEATRPPRGGKRLYPAPIALVDATADPETVFLMIRREVMLALALDPRT